MTTKPKARKFRIKRTPQSGASPATPTGEPKRSVRPKAATPRPAAADATPAAAAPQPAAQTTAQTAAQPATQPGASGYASQTVQSGGMSGGVQGNTATAAQMGDVASAREVDAETDIDAIRKEGLTGRQLRMARRMAQKHEIAATSDFDAVRQLRLKGIDPFQRANMLELVVPDGREAEAKGDGRVQLPQTIKPGQNLPSTELSPADRRANEITMIQRDILMRRRKRLMLMLTRLSAFVFLPTLLAGWYFFAIATPMYATKSEFLIIKADSEGGIGGLFGGTQFATSQDSIAVQSYLQSKDAMQRLDGDIGFKAHFAQDWIDPIQRLAHDASNESAYKIYKKGVKIGYDPTEGVLRMEVVAADPQVSAEFSILLLRYAEERVDTLSQRKRDDGMITSRESVARAKDERRAAQIKIVELQQKYVPDPAAEQASIRALIGTLEARLQEKELQLRTLLNNARPNKSKVDAAEAEVVILNEEIDRQHARLTRVIVDKTLPEIATEMQIANSDLIAADASLQSALEGERLSANEQSRKVRYLETSVRPVAAEDATYPRSFENTILAFLIFSGIYLMVSLTSSILREQVSS